MAKVKVKNKPFVYIKLTVQEAEALKDLLIFGDNECDDEFFADLEPLLNCLLGFNWREVKRGGYELP